MSIFGANNPFAAGWHWPVAEGLTEDLALLDTSIQVAFQDLLPWGIEASIDLFGCAPGTIRSEDTIRAFAINVCEKIGMRRYGDPLLVHFGADERISGYSLVQLIETSAISAHFIEQDNAVCLNIFSCSVYPPYMTAALCQHWFAARDVRVSVVFRGPHQAVLGTLIA